MLEQINFNIYDMRNSALEIREVHVHKKQKQENDCTLKHLKKVSLCSLLSGVSLHSPTLYHITVTISCSPETVSICSWLLLESDLQTISGLSVADNTTAVSSWYT